MKILSCHGLEGLPERYRARNLQRKPEARNNSTTVHLYPPFVAFVESSGR